MGRSYNPFGKTELPPKEGWVMSAVNKKDISKIREAVAKNPENIDYTVTDSTPLMIAAGNKNFDMAELLLELGANIKTTNRTGANLAHISSKHNGISLLKIITEKEPELFNKTNVRNETPLFSALRHKNLEAFSFIMNNQLDDNINRINTEGKTVLDFINDEKLDEMSKTEYQPFKNLLLENNALSAIDIDTNEPAKKTKSIKQKTEIKNTNTMEKEEHKKEKKQAISGLSNISKKRKNNP